MEFRKNLNLNYKFFIDEYSSNIRCWQIFRHV